MLWRKPPRDFRHLFFGAFAEGIYPTLISLLGCWWSYGAYIAG